MSDNTHKMPVVNGETNKSNNNSTGLLNGHATRSAKSNTRLDRPFLIGVAGGPASGKSTVCERIIEQLGQNKVDTKERRVVTVSLDSFYRPLTDDDQLKASKGQFNFDHPDAFDHDMLIQTIRDITQGKTVKVPMYDFCNHKWKVDCYQTIYPADVVLFEGILLFYLKEVRDRFDMKLFVDTDPDTRLSRRVMRDAHEHGRNIESILFQYTTFVKPAFEEFCLPTKKHADVIIPRGADNTVAIELIVQHIQDLLHHSPKIGRKVLNKSQSVIEKTARPH